MQCEVLLTFYYHIFHVCSEQRRREREIDRERTRHETAIQNSADSYR